METISPDHKYPASKVLSPPPLTPFNITIASHQHILPPIKSLPTWNRTRLGIKRTVGPVLKSNNTLKQVEFERSTAAGQFEQCTQTSPLSSRQSSVYSGSPVRSIKTPVAVDKQAGGNNVKAVYEKQIVFIQSNHKVLLTNLHDELEQLKFDNKALNFDLVNMRDQMEKVKFESTGISRDNNTEAKLTNQVKLLEQQLKEMKTELDVTKENNKKLLEVVRSQNKNISQTSSHQFKKSARNRNNMRMKSSHRGIDNGAVWDTNMNLNRVRSGNSKENCASNNAISVDNCQSQQCVHKNESEFLLPNIHSNMKKTVVNSNLSPRVTNEPIKLPVLQPFPFPNTNASLRRKRTKALHSQKHRSGKELGVFLAPK